MKGVAEKKYNRLGRVKPFQGTRTAHCWEEALAGRAASGRGGFQGPSLCACGPGVAGGGASLAAPPTLTLVFPASSALDRLLQASRDYARSRCVTFF